MKKITKTIALAACTIAGTTAAKADTDPFIGTIMQVGENYCPRYWAETNGQLLPISQYTALFSLLGTMYGGDGRTTFALPDMQGRFGMNVGTGPGLSGNRQGQKIGLNEVTHTLNTLPAHSHAVQGTITASVAASSNLPNVPGPDNAYKSTFPSGSNVYASGSSANVPMGDQSVHFTNNVTLNTAGDQRPITNQQPFLVVKTCIALEGQYPSRN